MSYSEVAAALFNAARDGNERSAEVAGVVLQPLTDLLCDCCVDEPTFDIREAIQVAPEGLVVDFMCSDLSFVADAGHREYRFDPAESTWTRLEPRR